MEDNRLGQIIQARQAFCELSVNEPRSIAIYLARQLEDYPLKVVADYFGIRHYSRVSKVHSGIKKKIKEHLTLKRKVDHILLNIRTQVKT